MKRRIKINGIIIALAVLFLVVFPAVFIRNSSGGLWEETAEIFGLVFILFGQVIRVSARGYKSELSCNGHTLIQGGPYAIVRNPMYLGIVLIGLGVVLVLFNWWAACIFLFIFVIRYLPLIFKEEKELLALFPETYQDYCRRVPRMLPSLSAILKMNISECLPLKLPWLKKEVVAISAVLLITLFLESWEEIKNEGIGIYIKEAAILIIAVILFVGLIIYLTRKTVVIEKNVPGKSKITL